MSHDLHANDLLQSLSCPVPMVYNLFATNWAKELESNRTLFEMFSVKMLYIKRVILTAIKLNNSINTKMSFHSHQMSSSSWL